RIRLESLRKAELRPVVYGGWGHQIDWMGAEFFIEWWSRLVEAFDELDPVYCLTGELDLWLGEAGKVWPDLDTGDLARSQLLTRRLPSIDLMLTFARQVHGVWKRLSGQGKLDERIRQWSAVLAQLRAMTERPLIVHTTTRRLAREAVLHPEYLAAETAQTGHMESARRRLWTLPQNTAPAPFINLEPWYEGIRGHFHAEDQLFALWASRLAGASGHAYGAHGLWNAGDGQFLAHWGSQTLDEAIALDTPELLGASSRVIDEWGSDPSEGRTPPRMGTAGGRLTALHRGRLTFVPDASIVSPRFERVWLPMTAEWADTWPQAGLAVAVTTMP
ncbi:MAG: DUF4038 domain-containing protein, partial [Bacteroidota bacterium]